MAMKNNLLISVLTTTVAVGGIVTFASTDEVQAKSGLFKDVKETDYYYDSLTELVQRGIVSGYEDGTFKASQYITRAQVARVLANSLGLEVEAVQDSGFKDVSGNHPNDAYIAAVVEAGIMSGYADNTFKPNDFITRAELSKILVLAYGLSEDTSIDLPFTDVNKQDVYAKYIQVLYNHKITSGTTPSTYSPSKYVSRGQFVTFVCRTEKEKSKDTDFELTIMHMNDTHSRVENAPKRVTAVNEVRAENPNALLLDAGDVFTGTLYFNEYKGRADLEFMNLMKVDAMTFGNHEFDLGSSAEGHLALRDFIKAANFPFVSANVNFSKDSLFKGLFNTRITKNAKDGHIYAGMVKVVDGEKIGIFGLTTAETVAISSPGSIAFEDYIQEAKVMVAEFRKMGVNKIVALTHIGYDDNASVDNDIELAKAVKGIDVIVGGHSHTQLVEPVIIKDNHEPTVIVQAYQYGEFLGTLDVTFDKKGVVVEHEGELIKIADKADNPQALQILSQYKGKIDAVQAQEIGSTAKVNLDNPRTNGNDANPSVRKNETPLGNLITDGMLAKAKQYDRNVVIAMQNGGGIRAAINQGPITVGEVMTVLPFGNTLATIKLSGEELKAAFEISFKAYPAENGGFLHVAGAKIQFNSSKTVGERVVSIALKNEDGTYTEVSDNQIYTIATNAFTAKGGDGYDVFANAYKEGRVTDLGLSDWENFRDHLMSLGEVNPQLEGRIVDIAK